MLPVPVTGTMAGQELSGWGKRNEKRNGAGIDGRHVLSFAADLQAALD